MSQVEEGRQEFQNIRQNIESTVSENIDSTFEKFLTGEVIVNCI